MCLCARLVPSEGCDGARRPYLRLCRTSVSGCRCRAAPSAQHLPFVPPAVGDRPDATAPAPPPPTAPPIPAALRATGLLH